MTLSGHEDWVNRVAFSPDGNYLATLGQDYIVNIWDLSFGLAVTTIDIQSESTAALWAIDFSPDGAQLAIGSYNNIEFWDTDSGELLSVFEKNDVRIMAVVFSPDGTQLAFSTTNGIVKIWDLENNEELLHINAHNSHVWGMVFNSDWSKLATQGGEATIKYWDATTGELLLNLTGHTDSIFGPVFSPNGKSLVSASSDYTMRVWVLPLEELIALGEARVTRAMTTEECQQYLHVDACPVE
jgi:WD40 repeat protein